MSNIIDINDELSKKRRKDLKLVSDNVSQLENAADLVYQECIDGLLKNLRDYDVLITENPIFDRDFDMVKTSLRFTINRQFGIKK